MPTKLSELNANIASLRDQLSDAEKRHLVASAALAMTPSDPEARALSRATEGVCADLRGDLKLLNDARGAAVQADQTSEAQALKREAVQHLNKAKQLSTLRNEAAQKLDATMAAFSVACREWLAVNADLWKSTSSFYHLVKTGDAVHTMDLLVQLKGAELVPCNALLSQFDTAVRGIVPRSSMALNYTTRFGDVELIAADVEKSGCRLITGMNSKAVSEGLQA
jgi:hypothetical protein